MDRKKWLLHLISLSIFMYLFPSQANWDEHCMNVSSALHHVLKAWQCDTKAVPPDQLQVMLVHLMQYVRQTELLFNF